MAAWVAAHRPDLDWLCPQLPPSPRAAIDGVFAAIADWPRERMAVDRQLARRLLRDRGGRAHRLPRRASQSRRSSRRATSPPTSASTTAWHSDERFFFRAEYIDELLRARAAGAAHRPERYFAVIAKGDEVLSWREMSGRYAGSPMRLIEGSDHALSDFDALPAARSPASSAC